MLSAIGSSPLPNLVGSSKSAAGLDAQLAQYQVQLADWVNCPSCKTPEGKAKIAEISAKISNIEQRMKAREVAKQGDESDKLTNGSPASTSQDKPLPKDTVAAVRVAASIPLSPAISPLGTRVDVFA